MGCHSLLPGGVRASERLGAQTTVEGSGIPHEEQELIFDRFDQSPSKQLSRRRPGIGLSVAVRKVGDRQGAAS